MAKVSLHFDVFQETMDFIVHNLRNSHHFETKNYIHSSYSYCCDILFDQRKDVVIDTTIIVIN